jgi:hypothetical protein
MARSSVAALHPASTRNSSESKEPNRRPATKVGDGEANKAVVKGAPRKRQQPVPSGSRLWGFVRREEVGREKDPGLMPDDFAIWYDSKRCRFVIVADKTLIDDLAPVEFVQFVRELRHSTSQSLFKFENRHDGSAGRPIRVWS